jgi:hypothetical protein
MTGNKKTRGMQAQEPGTIRIPVLARRHAMANVLIRDIPDDVVEELKPRAKSLTFRKKAKEKFGLLRILA